MNAVQTDGLGKQTTRHLNLTVTLADVWFRKPPRIQPNAGLRNDEAPMPRLRIQGTPPGWPVAGKARS